jgi:putative ABC transport system substrate-binding protein
MKRRDLITLLAGAAAWPFAAGAQQAEPMRRIGVLMSTIADDREGQARIAAFVQGLQQLGWIDGRNVQMDVRWTGGEVERLRKYAAELATLAPDVIVTGGASYVAALQQATRTVPIVFAAATDPVAGGLVQSLARPGGNATGFTSADYGMSPKWLELLKDMAPRITRAAVLYDAGNPVGLAQFASIQAAAPSFGVELISVGLRDAGEIERAVAAFARPAGSGLIVTRTVEATIHRKLIIALAAEHHLPAVYPLRHFVAAGGLISYGPDYIDQYRQAAHYVDRIFKGEKPADLPVQTPTKYQLVINLKAAKALGLDVPPTLLARADEVIE